MNKLKIVRFTVIFLIVVSIALIFWNFSPTPEISVKKKSEKPINASMVIEKGNHDIYSKGEIFARLSYEKAVKTEKNLSFEKVKVVLVKNRGQLVSDSADFKEGLLTFKTVTRGIFPEKKIKTIIAPPSFLKDKVLYGDGKITLNFPDFSLLGNKFAFNLSDYMLSISKGALLNAKKLTLSSDYNVSDLNGENTLFFFKNVKMESEGVRVEGDLALDFPDKDSLFFRGGCKAVADNVSIFFNEGQILKGKSGYYLQIDGDFRFDTGDVKGSGYGAYFMKNKLNAEYLKAFFGGYIFSGVSNVYSGENQTLSGSNPFIFSPENKREIKGRTYKAQGKTFTVFSPVLKEENLFLVSSLCKMDKGGTAFFPKKVFGVFGDYAFSGLSAVLSKDKKVINKGEIISIEEGGDRVRGGIIELLNDGRVVLKDKVEINKEMKKGNRGKIFCDFMEISDNMTRIYIQDNVKIKTDKFSAYPVNGIIFKTYALLFDCPFEIQDGYKGFAKLIVLNFKTRYSYLFFANASDSTGNSIKGDKLTLDNLTDRIFIEKTKEKGHVEVKIKI